MLDAIASLRRISPIDDLGIGLRLGAGYREARSQPLLRFGQFSSSTKRAPVSNRIFAA